MDDELKPGEFLCEYSQKVAKYDHDYERENEKVFEYYMLNDTIRSLFSKFHTDSVKTGFTLYRNNLFIKAVNQIFSL